MEKDKSSKRIFYFDIVRVIAMFLVIGVHAVGSIAPYAPENAFSKGLAGVLDSLNSLGVPIFFALSGYFLLNQQIRDFLKWYKKHILHIIIPFALYAIGYVVYFVGYEQHNPMMIPVAYVRGLLCNEIHPTHWFVYAIIGLYFATPPLSRMFQAMTDREVRIIYWGSISLFLFSFLLSRWGLSFAVNQFVFNATNLFAYINGYCANRICHLRPFDFLSKYKWGFILVFLIGMQYYRDFSLFSTLAVALLLIPPQNNNLHYPNIIKKVITLLSRHSYSIYLVHVAVLSFILIIHRDWTRGFNIKIFLLYPLVCAISLVLVLVPDYYIDKILKKLSG
ncbi:MAG: acyltransferase [Lachnospiraceae bacterium]|nr:acyltransferase [Lachnospiraceae bacterium]